MFPFAIKKVSAISANDIFYVIKLIYSIVNSL